MEYIEIPNHPDHAIQYSPPYAVINISKMRTLTVQHNRDYPYVKIKDSKIYMHILIAQCFIPEYKEGCKISWKDGDKRNFFPENILIVNDEKPEIEIEEVIHTSINIRDQYNFRDFQKTYKQNPMATREDIIAAIIDLRRIFAAVNSTPKVFLFKDFSKGEPLIAVAKKSDAGLKLGDITMSSHNKIYENALNLYKLYKTLFTYDDVCFYSNNPLSFTFFRGYDIEPSDGYNEACITPFINFVHAIICDGNESVFAYILQWVATILQRPDTKLEVALVILGETRTGKNTFTNVLCNLFGRYAIPNITDINHVIGKFNTVFEYKRLVICNELERVSASNRINFDRLKSIITDKTAS